MAKVTTVMEEEVIPPQGFPYPRFTAIPPGSYGWCESVVDILKTLWDAVGQIEGGGDIPASIKDTGIGINLDGRGSLVTTGQKGYLYMMYAAKIIGWVIIADQPASSATYDIWVSQDYPTVANSICGTAKPTLTNDKKIVFNSVPAWTKTQLAVGDVIGWNLDSVTTATGLIFELLLEKI